MNKFGYLSFGIFIFTFSITLLFSQNRALSKLLQIQKEVIFQDNEDVLYQYSKSNEEKLTEYSEIVMMLMNEPTYDIEINGVNISKEMFEIELFDFNSIPQGNYQKKYIMKQNGEVDKIIYTRRLN